MSQTPKVIILLYVLLAYVFFQFAWWAYLIYDLNASILELNFKLAEMAGSLVTDGEGELRQKLWMILGEGSVFLSLLILGAYYIRKFILREQRLAKQERNFLLATTHELNSPLAAIRLNLQTLQKREVDAAQKASILDGALSATGRLQDLVSNLLTASRIDAGKLEILRERVDLEEFFGTLMKRYQPLADKASNQLQLDVEPNTAIHADRRALDTLVGNLIENAIKYAPNSRIDLIARQNGDTITIIVQDHGPGIDKSEIQSIFKKFYRIENEETRTQKGSGLGLFLVHELVELHGGTVHVESNQGAGSRFTITLKNTQ